MEKAEGCFGRSTLTVAPLRVEISIFGRKVENFFIEHVWLPKNISFKVNLLCIYCCLKLSQLE